MIIAELAKAIFQCLRKRWHPYRVAGIPALLAIWTLCAAVGSCSDRREDCSELVLLCPSGKVLSVIEPTVREFMAENPGQKVRIISSPAKSYYTKTLSLLAAKQKVDVLWLGQGLGMFAARGTLLALEPFFEKDASISRKDFSPIALSLYKSGGVLCGLPYGLDLEVLAVNDDMLKRLGIPLPDANWTYEEFLEIGRRASMHDDANGRKIHGLGMNAIPPGFVGLSVMSPDGTEFGLRKPGAVEWLETNMKLNEKGVLLPSAEGQFDRLNEFLSERVAIMRVFTWELPELKSKARFSWRLLPQPRNAENSQYAWGSSAGFSIAASSSCPEQSWKLLKALTGARVQSALSGSSVPTLVKELEAYQERLEPREQAISRIFPTVRADPRIKKARAVMTEWRYWNDKMMQGQITPEAALDISEKRINRLLQHP